MTLCRTPNEKEKAAALRHFAANKRNDAALD